MLLISNCLLFSFFHLLKEKEPNHSTCMKNILQKLLQLGFPHINILAMLLISNCLLFSFFPLLVHLLKEKEPNHSTCMKYLLQKLLQLEFF